jgi:phosphopantothenoylcysteine decarboxylase
MTKVLLGVTGSVAAIKTPLLYAGLKAAGHAVRVVATRPALYFFDPAELDPLPGEPPRRSPAVVSLDEDEWPGRDAGRRWQRQDPVLHIELRRWAEALVIAPLDANTLAKLASGLADNCLTCVWRAWDPGRPVVLAPAMNTLMWQHPLTARHLRQLAMDEGVQPPAEYSQDELPNWINARCQRLRVVPPVTKVLACGDEGVGAMASQEEILGKLREVWPEGTQSASTTVASRSR